MYSLSEFLKLFNLRVLICIRYSLNYMHNYIQAFTGWHLTCQHLPVPAKCYAALSPALQPCHQAAGLAFACRGPTHHPSCTFKTINVTFSKTLKNLRYYFIKTITCLDIIFIMRHLITFCIFLIVYCIFPTFELRILLEYWEYYWEYEARKSLFLMIYLRFFLPLSHHSLLHLPPSLFSKNWILT